MTSSLVPFPATLVDFHLSFEEVKSWHFPYSYPFLQPGFPVAQYRPTLRARGKFLQMTAITDFRGTKRNIETYILAVL
jgi:hypothetical protein